MKDMVNNFNRESVAKLTFGDLSSDIASSGYPSEIALAFTPTTLAALERTFVAFGESVDMEAHMVSDSTSAQVNWEHSTSYSGMSDCSNDSEEDNSNSGDWAAGGKRKRKCDSSGEFTQTMTGDSRPARRLPGPRPSCRDEEMTPEELERRRRRRERNKTAAAKCRQRRVDQTNVLLQETKVLEDESQKLEKEIKALEQLKHQLEYVLEAHKPVCKADVNITTFKTEYPQSIPTSTPASRPTSLPITTTTALQVSSSLIPSTSAASQLFFDFPSTGLTPLADPLTFFGSLEGASPSLFLLSPSSLLAQ